MDIHIVAKLVVRKEFGIFLLCPRGTPIDKKELTHELYYIKR